MRFIFSPILVLHDGGRRVNPSRTKKTTFEGLEERELEKKNKKLAADDDSDA